jgi:hypothetical protein
MGRMHTVEHMDVPPITADEEASARAGSSRRDWPPTTPVSSSRPCSTPAGRSESCGTARPAR